MEDIGNYIMVRCDCSLLKMNLYKKIEIGWPVITISESHPCTLIFLKFRNIRQNCANYSYEK